MQLPDSLIEGCLLNRCDRYLAEIVLDDDMKQIVLCPTLRDVSSAQVLGTRIWCSKNSNISSNISYVWELSEVNDGHLVWMNHQRLVEYIFYLINLEKIDKLKDYRVAEHTHLPPLAHYDSTYLYPLTSKLGCEHGVLGIQTVSLVDEIGRGFFPENANVHDIEQMIDLMDAAKFGGNAYLLLCVMHTGAKVLYPADHIDQEYGYIFRDIISSGVQVFSLNFFIENDIINHKELSSLVVPKNKITYLGL